MNTQKQRNKRNLSVEVSNDFYRMVEQAAKSEFSSKSEGIRSALRDKLAQQNRV